jgi:hypothetical protein
VTIARSEITCLGNRQVPRTGGSAALAGAAWVIRPPNSCHQANFSRDFSSLNQLMLVPSPVHAENTQLLELYYILW